MKDQGKGKGKERAISPPELSESDSADSSAAVWPRGFYTLDVVKCFEACEANPTQPAESIFQKFFNVPFRRSTFYENKKRWQLAPQAAKDAALAAGHSTAGLWAKFAAANPAKRADTKAARKRFVRNGQF